jgi:16S rRNA (guanine527-N7)-methyltransferase
MVGAELTSNQAESLLIYAKAVLKWNRHSNLTGASSVRQFISEHIVDSLAVAPHISNGPLLDLGSGAGLPGLVLKIILPDIPMVLLEPRGKRARFLSLMRIELCLNALDIVARRIEEYEVETDFSYIITRAFGSASQFIEKINGLAGYKTKVIAMKGVLNEEEISLAEALWGSQAKVIRLEVPGFSDRHLVFFQGQARDTNAVASPLVT